MSADAQRVVYALVLRLCRGSCKIRKHSSANGYRSAAATNRSAVTNREPLRGGNKPLCRRAANSLRRRPAFKSLNFFCTQTDKHTNTELPMGGRILKIKSFLKPAAALFPSLRQGSGSHFPSVGCGINKCECYAKSQCYVPRGRHVGMLEATTRFRKCSDTVELHGRS